MEKRNNFSIVDFALNLNILYQKQAIGKRMLILSLLFFMTGIYFSLFFYSVEKSTNFGNLKDSDIQFFKAFVRILPLLLPILWIVVGTFLHIGCRHVGGRSGYVGSLNVVGLTLLLFLFLFISIIELSRLLRLLGVGRLLFFSDLFVFLSIGFSLVFLIRGLRRAHQISTAKTIFALFISFGYFLAVYLLYGIL